MSHAPVSSDDLCAIDPWIPAWNCTFSSCLLKKQSKTKFDDPIKSLLEDLELQLFTLAISILAVTEEFSPSLSTRASNNTQPPRDTVVDSVVFINVK